MELLDLFIAASMPVLKMLIVTVLGSYLALDHVNILGEDARKHLNTLVFYVFNPVLVATNLSKTITFKTMLTLWFMPFNVLIAFLIGSVLGWIVIRLTSPPHPLRGLILGCCAGGNVGNMLLIIIPAVCKEGGSPFGDPDVCYMYGMAYASLSMAIGSIYLWTYVYNVVRISSRVSTVESRKDNCSTPKSFEESSPEEPILREPLLSSKESSLLSDGQQDRYALPVPCTISEVKTEVGLGDKMKQHLLVLFKKIKSLMAPSTTGALVGFLIGLIPLLRRSLIGDNAPLRVIQDSASLLGDGAIPSVTLVVGGNLLRGLQASGIKKSIVIGIIIARYAALPLAGIVVVQGAINFGLVHSDPLYQFVLLLQFAVPPAMSIGTITQLFGAGESECSVIMLWTYALASISLTFWSTFFMWLVLGQPI